MALRRRDSEIGDRDLREWDDEGRGVLGILVDVAVLLAMLAGVAIVGTRFVSWSDASIVMLMQAALPLTMLPMWLALVVTVWKVQPIRLGIAAILCASHLFAMKPAAFGSPVPTWVTTADQRASFRLVAANTYFRNDHPGLGPKLASLDADVLVFSEFQETVQTNLAASGGLAAFPFSANDGTEKVNVAVYSRFEFVGAPRTVALKAPRAAQLLIVDVRHPTATVRVIAVHPEPGLGESYPAFIETMRTLREEVRQSPHPIVLAGDFNGNRWVPAVGELFAAGLTSAHESRGYGLSASWPEGGSLPRVLKLDHVLYSDGLAAVGVSDLVLPGSDHLAAVVDLAVRRQ